MGEELAKFSAGDMSKGLDQYEPDFDPEISLALPSINISSGSFARGMGPRYGAASLPGHSDQEATTGSALNGLRASEMSTGQGFRDRIKIYGIVPLKLAGYADLSVRGDYYAYLVSRVQPTDGNEYFDIILGSTISTTYQHSPSFLSGLHATSQNKPASGGYYEQPYEVLGELLRGRKSSTDFDAVLKSFLNINNQANYASFAAFNYSGADIPNNYLLGAAVSVPDATHGPNPNFNLNTWIGAAVNPTDNATGGVPSPFQFNSYVNGIARNVLVYGLIASGFIRYLWKHTIDTTNYGPALNYNTTNANIAFSASAGTQVYGGAIAGVVGAYVVDKLSTINCSYKAILAAGLGKAFCAIFQEWHRNTDGPLVQWVDLTENSLQVPTIAPAAGAGVYTEDGTLTPSCFRLWPIFVTGTAMVGFGDIALGAGGSGIFRAGTAYELTYSHYYKRLNYETNVGKPVKFNTSTEDFVALQLLLTFSGAAGVNAFTEYPAQPMPFTPFQTPNCVSINFIEYRFYYRLIGTFEWLPCGSIDAAQFWADPAIGNSINGFRIGTGAVAASTGGQTGGFNDYSLLPKDQYTCTVTFKNRAFWSSDKAVCFSNLNNILAYAGRNSVAAPSGKFKGMIVHNYPGQAEQNSRLIVFGTRETFVGRFSGQFVQSAIPVSPDTTATFDIDGTDFRLDPWTSVTSFSHRSAVVADGILYWWGPRGIHRDDGVDTPPRISGALEPDIFDFYDPTRTDEIHAVFNATTREITWFYPPKTYTGYATQSLKLNTRTGEFTHHGYLAKIDAAQNLEITSGASDVIGQRTLIMAREGDGSGVAKQRAYFYDHNNRSGDRRPNFDFMVKSFTSPTPSTRRLTLAAGFNTASLATMAVGDLICLDQLKRYTGKSLTLTEDFIGTVTAFSTSAGTIDIQVPDGVELDASATLTQPYYFPIWHAGAADAGMNGIPWTMQFNYWMPGGDNGASWYWEHVFMRLKMDLLKSVEPQKFLIEYRTPVSDDYAGDLITFIDNSDGHMQVYHNNQLGERSMEGQAIKLRLSGIHLGSRWVLQCLEVHASPVAGDVLKEFQESEL